MTLKQLIKRYGIPGITFGITLDSYRRTVYSHAYELAQKDAQNAENVSKIQSQWLGDINKSAAEKAKIGSRLSEWVETDDKLISTRSNLKAMTDKLLTKTYGPGENHQSVSTMKNIYETRVAELEQNQSIHKKELYEFLKDIQNSDALDWLWNLIENYRLFLSTLNLDQIVAVLNIIGHFMVLSAVTSITIILAGNYLINILNLEVKFPKLAFWIKTREKLTKTYLWLHVLFLFIILFINIGTNLYVFFISYNI